MTTPGPNENLLHQARTLIVVLDDVLRKLRDLFLDVADKGNVLTPDGASAAAREIETLRVTSSELLERLDALGFGGGHGPDA